ncbi:MAG: class I SAM-dependent methyltransferase, partial [Thermodesulfobacteriota bacterium]|nr:class I SAM-dependent methyltransferase [Thermodesulfobacteriota bacterium]
MKHADMSTMRREEVFHDGWSQSIDIHSVHVDDFFTACTAPENRLILKRLGSLSGQRVVDLGCGAGEASVYFAKMGAEVIATDLSKGMLKVATRLAEAHGVSIATRQCSADDTPFPAESFDIAYAANLLHHVEIEDALREANRVLKKGGVFVSWDPLAHNPIINVYRRLASSVRTEDEHPLSMSQLRLFRKHFSRVEYETTWLATLLVFMKFFLVDRIDPNKERYW